MSDLKRAKGSLHVPTPSASLHGTPEQAEPHDRLAELNNEVLQLQEKVKEYARENLHLDNARLTLIEERDALLAADQTRAADNIGGQELNHDQVLALLWRYKRALEGLTAGGSEFVNNPERCAERVRSSRDSSHNTILRLTTEKKAAEADISRLTGERDEAKKLVAELEKETLDLNIRSVLAKLNEVAVHGFNTANSSKEKAPTSGEVAGVAGTQKCAHCGRPIEMRNGEWRHVMYHGAYCFKPAEPAAAQREPQKESQ